MRDENKLSLIYDKRQKDFVVYGPNSHDRALILCLLRDTLIFSFDKQIKGEKYPYEVENLKNELEQRGYDLTTIKFSIKKKQ